jgi:hypothetical protein
MRGASLELLLQELKKKKIKKEVRVELASPNFLLLADDYLDS